MAISHMFDYCIVHILILESPLAIPKGPHHALWVSPQYTDFLPSLEHSLHLIEYVRFFILQLPGLDEHGLQSFLHTLAKVWVHARRNIECKHARKVMDFSTKLGFNYLFS